MNHEIQLEQFIRPQNGKWEIVKMAAIDTIVIWKSKYMYQYLINIAMDILFVVKFTSVHSSWYHKSNTQTSLQYSFSFRSHLENNMLQ